MPSPFHGIEMMSRALRSFQRGLDVTGHNISNVNTKGYTRQSIDYGATPPTQFWGGQYFTLGTGVTVQQVNRIRDMFLEGRMIGAQGELGRFETLSASLRQVEPVFNEPGPNGINSALNRYFNAWSGLSSNPGDDAARREVQASGDILAGRIRSTFGELTKLENQYKAQTAATFDDIDQLASRINELNDQIKNHVAMGDHPNDLLDQRDLAVQELGRIVPVNTFDQENGSVMVYVGQFSLVDAGGAHAIPRTYDATTNSITDGVHTFPIKTGRLRGLFDSLNQVASYKSSMDTFANTLRDSVNAMHVTGVPPSGNLNVNFFSDSSIGAGDFALSTEVKADFRNIVNSATGVPGDGGLALSIAGLRDSNQASLSSKSFTRFFTDFISDIGRDTQTAEVNFNTQIAVADQLDQQIQSVSGVSIDEEMSQMLRLQRSYQAAAKALSVMDEMTEDLINMVR